MRLIDADKLAEEIADSINDASIQNDELSLSILRVFKKTVDDEPTIDAEPVKHGRWIINPDGYYPYCSECKEEPESGKMTRFCPNCGAKMKGDANNA